MKILITAPYAEKELKDLEDQFEKIFYLPWKPHGRAYNEEELIKMLHKTSANALITEHDEVTEKVINSFPNLKFIGVCRGTPSNVAVKAADKHGIIVFHTPARNAQAVAEMFISSLIVLLRKIIPSHNWLLEERWAEGAHTSYLEFKGNELAGKTIGMVGFGAVGQLIANIAQAFPCKIQFYDPFVDDVNPEFKKIPLDELFETSDIVSIHLPVNENTIGMIDKTLLTKMKEDAIFVNTARASVVNREDLLEILQNKKIQGAYLDVFDHEPPDALDYKIIHLPNVFATPHTAGATFEVENHHSRIMNSAIFNRFPKV